ncbi:GumC family protein [Shewanella sp. TC10]|uniref:GumC family protein n=1 Tax=Shewanella sp. TC10 TaxID=1419739 RepID=UPI00129EF735|nr:polysaccharide biosynthesis tyrosine autokinase [Shewanella sp. TC10]
MMSNNPQVKTTPIIPEQLIDFKKLFKPILFFKWRILAFSIIVTALTVFVVMSMKPIYSATSTLLIESEQASAIKIDEVYGINSGQREYYLTQFEILKSRSIAERVFNELDLVNHPQFLPQPSLFKQLKNSIDFLPKEEAAPVDENKVFQQKINGFANNIIITPIRKTQLVNISYETPDPELASLVSNAVGDAYILSQLEAKAGMTQKANIWLGGRLEDLRVNLDASEHRLEQFRIDNGLVDVEGVTALDAKELQRLSDDITLARSRKAQADSFMAVVKKYGASDIGRLESLPEVTSHLSIQNVKREVSIVERKVSELQQVYGPKHPKLISAKAELATVENNLRVQIGRLVQGIEDEAQTASQNLRSLEAQFNSSKGDFQDLSTIDTTYKRLLREVNTNQQLFESFLSRQKETEVTGDFDSPVARFTDRAVTPFNPIKPNKKLIVVAAFLASLIFAMVIVLVLDALNDTIKTTDDVEKVLSQRALGYIPKADKKATYDEVNFAFYDSNAKMHAESVRTIRTSLSLMALGQDLTTIEVTSSFPNEGKTSVAMNLAFAFSGMEKVLIIDADMRKPNVGSRFGLPNYQPGLSNVLAGSEAVGDCIAHDVKPNVDVLTAGAIPLNPQELLSTPILAKVIQELKQHYTKIIIDTPPVQAVSDALVIAPHSDAIVTVVKAATTRSEAVRLTLAKLYQARGKVFGVVLNQLNIKDAQQYHGQYGYYQPYESNSVEESETHAKAS